MYWDGKWKTKSVLFKIKPVDNKGFVEHAPCSVAPRIYKTVMRKTKEPTTKIVHLILAEA